MALVIDIETGDCYSTYPSELQPLIELYKNPLYEEQFAIFRILDAIYNSKEPYSVQVRPIWNWGLGDYTWDYTIKSPIITWPVKIKTFERRLTTTTPRDEYNLSNQKWDTEYHINLGKLYSAQLTNASDKLIVYQCRRFIEPAYDAFMQNGGDKKIRRLEKQRRQNLIKMADKVLPYSAQK